MAFFRAGSWLILSKFMFIFYTHVLWYSDSLICSFFWYHVLYFLSLFDTLGCLIGTWALSLSTEAASYLTWVNNVDHWHKAKATCWLSVDLSRFGKKCFLLFNSCRSRPNIVTIFQNKNKSNQIKIQQNYCSMCYSCELCHLAQEMSLS